MRAQLLPRKPCVRLPRATGDQVACGHGRWLHAKKEKNRKKKKKKKKKEKRKKGGKDGEIILDLDR